MSEATKTRRFGFKRWIILGLTALGIYAAFIGPSYLKPISPVVVLPAEPISPNSLITNTMLATLVADVVLLLFAFGAWRFHKSGKQIPSGFYNFFEVLVEFLWNGVEGATGKWAKRVFPVVATIFMLVFFANLTKLVPGYESIGWLKEAHKAPAYAVIPLFKLGEMTVYTLDKGQPVEVETHSEGEAATSETHAEGETTTEGVPCHACEVVPFLRGAATDLNFPLALALIAVRFITDPKSLRCSLMHPLESLFFPTVLLTCELP